MMPRTEYEMSKTDLETLLASMKPTPVIMIGGSTGPSQQELANSAWARLGEKLGFVSSTVKPHAVKGPRFFYCCTKTSSTKSFRGCY